MERIPIYDAKTRLSEYGRLAKEGGRRFVVTNRGEDMFEIGPVHADGEPASRSTVMDAIEGLTAQVPREGRDQARADREQGRE